MIEDSELCLVLTTLADEGQAREMSRELVQSGLAACVNILPEMTSVYCWEDEMHEDREIQLCIKAPEELIDDLSNWLVENHPYDTPEILVQNVDRASSDYEEWAVGEACGC